MRKCVGGCLSKDTRIMMGDGSEKIITEIHIGDSVLLRSGETDRISDILTGMEFEMLHIETNNGSLVVTDSHPILSDGEKWVQAVDLKIGDSVCIKNGTAKVISIQRMSYCDSVYNIRLFNGTYDGIYANGIIVGDMDRQERMYKVQEDDISPELEMLLRDLKNMK